MRHPVRHRSPIAAGLAAACMLAGGCGRTPPSPVAPAAPALPSPPPLCARIEAAIAHARDARRLDASVHGAWQVVHGILAFGPDFPLARDGVVGPALDYLLGGSPLIGWQLRPGKRGIVAVVEEGSTTGQGHPDQWLGYLSQCGLGGVPLDTKLVVGGRDFTLADLLAQAQFDIRPGQEATWTLMALAAYLPPDASWQASDGTAWTIERVVQMEADADLSTSACGGAHRLAGLALALAAHRAAHADPDAPLSGGWATAADRLADAIDRARRFQQPDGSFSTHFFDRPGTSPDVFARLAATGHIFEVLVLALDDGDLAAPWVTRSAERLVTLLEQTRDVDVECGALYHAVHGLALYNRRVCPRPTLASTR
ncbi:MAG: hypothetical protein ACKOBP_06000 [Planctomycetia bacterium]